MEPAGAETSILIAFPGVPETEYRLTGTAIPCPVTSRGHEAEVSASLMLVGVGPSTTTSVGQALVAVAVGVRVGVTVGVAVAVGVLRVLVGVGVLLGVRDDGVRVAVGVIAVGVAAEHGPCAPTTRTMSAAVIAPSRLTSALPCRLEFPSPATAWITADKSAGVTCPSPFGSGAISAGHVIDAARAAAGCNRHQASRPVTRTLLLEPLTTSSLQRQNWGILLRTTSEVKQSH